MHCRGEPVAIIVGMSTDVTPALSGKPLETLARPALSRPSHASRWLALLLALGCGAAGLVLASHYPLLTYLVVALYLGVVAASFRWWQAAPLLLIGLVPVLGFATWTGWFVFEELDLLVLAAAAGGYAAYALGRAGDKTSVWRRPLAPSALAKLLLLLFALSLLLSVWRGLLDAGGLEFGWWQGYLEPMNSLRQAKGFVYALLLLPLWQRAGASRPDRVERGMLLAMCLALAGISLAALWERIAFPGFLNFSTDYRSTAMFWEMQVGGAMLEGAVLLCLPFALAALMRQRSPGLIALLLVLVLMGLYAALTTFSRGVYLALPVMLATLLVLSYRQHLVRKAESAIQPQHLETLLAGLPLASLLLLAGCGASRVSDLAGPASGLSFAGLMLLLGLDWWRQPGSGGVGPRLVSICMAVLLSLLVVALSWSLQQRWPMGPALIGGLLLVVGLALAVLAPARVDASLRVLVTASIWLSALGSLAIAILAWGRQVDPFELRCWLFGLAAVGCVSLGLSASTAWTALAAPWRAAGAKLSAVLAAALLVSGFLAGLLGTQAVASRDALDVRIDHWRGNYWLLHGDQERWLGRGSGRLPAARFYEGAEVGRAGDFRLAVDEQGHGMLRASGPRGTGMAVQPLRLSQRVDQPSGTLRLKFLYRTQAPAALQFEIAEKHLLRARERQLVELPLAASAGQWQTAELNVPALSASAGGSWWAPRLIVFSLAETTESGEVDIRELSLVDAAGRSLLGNGNFADGLARWYLTSDEWQLPWHAKNLALHLQFEQGWVGLALWACLAGAVIWRCAFGRASAHPLAPATAAALIGFLVLGLFDSLLDAPRLSFLFYCVLLLGLGLRALMPGGQTALAAVSSVTDMRGARE